ncbi:MAG: DUF294 nucleotidyltransferase-like domain-containing protein [Thermoanaerobaculia bacterium]|nr:DUF294 nucleotidyltransferase-like domain-containing protein [Thermoanaerobaculia bacterium]
MARERFEPEDSYLAAPVSDVSSRSVLWIEPRATLTATARRMWEADAGSILVRADEDNALGTGIVTDRDLRRVLAQGLDPETPVGELASRPLLTLRCNASVAAAHLAMLEAGVRHLALTDDGSGEAEPIVGIVTSTDLHRHQSRGPFFVLHRLERDAEAAVVGDYVKHREDAVRSLRSGGVAADRIGRIVSHLDDHLVRRCLRAEVEILESESGPLPADWAWVAFGSDGRREQPVLLDQHNALIFDVRGLGADEAVVASEIFHRLATRVSERLLAAGWPEPDSGFVARRWCTHLDEWQRRFRHWLEEPDPESLEHAQVFFDLRRVAGPLEVGLASMVHSVESASDFLRLMAVLATRRRPAVGRWRGLTRDGNGAIDLQSGGLRPLVALARVAGICVGLTEPARWPISTLERLRAAERRGLLSQADVGRLQEIYSTLSDRCLDLLLASTGGAPAGRPVASMRPSDLTRTQRSRLASDLRFVRRQQRALETSIRRWKRAVVQPRGAT